MGLIVSTNPFFPELVQEFESLAVAQGYEVLIGSTNYEPARTESLIRRMLQRNVDGVAVMTFGIEEELVQKLVEREFPLVFVDAGPDLPNIRVLKVNYAEGIRQAVQHLAALGHRRIAFITGPLRLRSVIACRDAFLKSMTELGLTVPAAHIAEGTHYTMEGGIVAMEQLSSKGELPTAVMCSNDMTAIGALHALFRANRNVPREISVVGFDDIHLAQFMLPPLTTVQMSCKDLAAAAVEALRAGIEQDHPKAAKKEWQIPTRLVVRQIGRTASEGRSPTQCQSCSECPFTLLQTRTDRLRRIRVTRCAQTCYQHPGDFHPVEVAAVSLCNLYGPVRV